MSVATVITRGFGSFGSVHLLPTLGFSAAVIVPDAVFTITTSAAGTFLVSTSSPQSFSIGSTGMGVKTDLSIPYGQNRVWQASYMTPTVISGFTFAFNVRDAGGNLLLQITQTSTTSGQITIADATNGVLNIQVTSTGSQLPLKVLSWDLWRIDAGHEDQLGYGTLTVDPSFYLAPTV